MLSRKIPSSLLSLANYGDADSQFEVAELLRQDDDPDFTMIAYWYRKAAEQGHSEAQNNLGTLYQRGLGVTQDDTEAVLWYQFAAEQGEPIAQYNLATRYRLGEGVPLDLTEAIKWLRRSAKQDYRDAVADLGVAYWLGHGVAKDIVRAAAVLDAAAEMGDVTAIINLTCLFDELESLARQGVPRAQHMVGVTYSHGFSKPQDLVLACIWMSVALENLSDKDDKRRCRHEIQQIRKALSHEDLKHAKNLVLQLKLEIHPPQY